MVKKEKEADKYSCVDNYVCPFDLTDVSIQPPLYVSRVHTCIQECGRVNNKDNSMIFRDYIGKVCCFAGTQYVGTFVMPRNVYLACALKMIHRSLEVVPLDYAKTLLNDLIEMGKEIIKVRESNKKKGD